METKTDQKHTEHETLSNSIHVLWAFEPFQRIGSVDLQRTLKCLSLDLIQWRFHSCLNCLNYLRLKNTFPNISYAKQYDKFDDDDDDYDDDDDDVDDDGVLVALFMHKQMTRD